MNEQDFIKRYRYDVRTDKIGGGSFGTVYKAYDRNLDQWKAIKVSQVREFNGKVFSLVDEFESAKALPEHRNIANYEKVYQFENYHGVYDYAVMQYYPLGSLKSLMKSAKLSPVEKYYLVKDILNGIVLLHENNIIHRDLKPANILITKDNIDRYVPKIADFGLSKILGDSHGTSIDNSFEGGTLEYSSPEQLKGQKLRRNTDLWSFAIISFELLLGKRPYIFLDQSGSSAGLRNEIFHQILKDDFTKQFEDCPEPLGSILSRCLVHDFRKRARSAKDLYIELQDFELQKKLEDVEQLDTPTIIAGMESVNPMKVHWFNSLELWIDNKVLKYNDRRERQLYDKVKNSENLSELEKFVNLYPESSFTVEIKERLEVLKEEKRKEEESLFMQVMESGSIQDLKHFIYDYPQGIYVSRIENRINELTAFEALSDSEDIRALESFLQQFPDSTYSDEVRTKKKSISDRIEKERIEQHDYEALQGVHDLEALNLFVEKYPNSGHFAAIKKRIDEITDAQKILEGLDIESIDAVLRKYDGAPWLENGKRRKEKLQEVAKLQDSYDLEAIDTFLAQSNHSVYAALLEKRRTLLADIEKEVQSLIADEDASGIKTFIEKHPNYAKVDQLSLLLEEMEAFNQCKLGDVVLQEAFLKKYPNSRYRQDVEFRISEANRKQNIIVVDNLISSGSVDEILDFIKENPNHHRVAELNNVVEEIQACKHASEDISSIDAFLEKYPSTRFRDMLMQKREVLQKAQNSEVEKLLEDGTESDLKQFIEKNPVHDRISELTRIHDELEDYKNVNIANIGSITHFLEKYPNSRYTDNLLKYKTSLLEKEEKEVDEKITALLANGSPLEIKEFLVSDIQHPRRKELEAYYNEYSVYSKVDKLKRSKLEAFIRKHKSSRFIEEAKVQLRAVELLEKEVEQLLESRDKEAIKTFLDDHSGFAYKKKQLERCLEEEEEYAAYLAAPSEQKINLFLKKYPHSIHVPALKEALAEYKKGSDTARSKPVVSKEKAKKQKSISPESSDTSIKDTSKVEVDVDTDSSGMQSPEEKTSKRKSKLSPWLLLLLIPLAAGAYFLSDTKKTAVPIKKISITEVNGLYNLQDESGNFLLKEGFDTMYIYEDGYKALNGDSIYRVNVENGKASYFLYSVQESSKDDSGLDLTKMSKDELLQLREVTKDDATLAALNKRIKELFTQEMESEYLSIQNSNDLDVLQNFLAKYPRTKYRTTIQGKIDAVTQKLQQQSEKDMYNQAIREGSKGLFALYIEKFPNGKYKDDALRRIQEMSKQEETAAWNTAKSKNEFSSYQSFVKRFPRSTYVSLAEQAMKRLTEAKQSERWEKIKEEGDSLQIKKYISEVGDLKLRNSAENELKSIRFKNRTIDRDKEVMKIYNEVKSLNLSPEDKKELDNLYEDMKRNKVSNRERKVKIIEALKRLKAKVERAKMHPVHLYLEDDFVRISGGAYKLGCKSGNCQDNELPTIDVNIKPFYISRYEVTQKLYSMVMDYNPSRYQVDCEECPVENISYNDAIDFLHKLNNMEGNKYLYRLPTEAEWEFAALGGDSFQYAGSANPRVVAQFGHINGERPVARKAPNGYGLYDMSGNIAELTSDWYKGHGESKNKRKYKVLKGGSWRQKAQNTRVYNREPVKPGQKELYIGFRMVRKKR